MSRLGGFQLRKLWNIPILMISTKLLSEKSQQFDQQNSSNLYRKLLLLFSSIF